MLKIILRILSIGGIIAIISKPFTNSTIINNLYRFDEFMHWILIPCGILILYTISNIDSILKDNPEKLKEFIDNFNKSKNSLNNKIMGIINILLIPYLFIFIADYSFGICVSITSYISYLLKNIDITIN